MIVAPLYMVKGHYVCTSVMQCYIIVKNRGGVDVLLWYSTNTFGFAVGPNVNVHLQ